MPLSFRLGAFYFSFFVYAGLMVAYFPPYLAARGLGAAEIAWLPAALVTFSIAGLGVALLLPPSAAHIAAPSLRLPANAATLLASAFFMAVAHGALYAFFTLHLQGIGYSGSLIGFLWALGVIAEIAGVFFLPALFRRDALSTLLIASAACAGVRFLAIGWAADWLALLLAAQLRHAATFGAFHAAAVAAVHRVFPAHAHARGQTLFSSLGYGAGGAAGVLLAGWAWQVAGPEVAFTLSAGAALAGLLFAYPLKRAGL